MSDHRVALLRATLGFLSIPARELRLLHRYADTWRGIGDVVAGMARQEYDLELELRRYDGVSLHNLVLRRGTQFLPVLDATIPLFASDTSGVRSVSSRFLNDRDDVFGVGPRYLPDLRYVHLVSVESHDEGISSTRRD